MGPTELLPTPALDPELLNLTAPHLPMNMALPLTLDLGPGLEKLLLRPQESMALPQLMNTELRLMLDPDLVMLLKLPENMAPLLTTHMALLPRRARARATRATRLEGRAA